MNESPTRRGVMVVVAVGIVAVVFLLLGRKTLETYVDQNLSSPKKVDSPADRGVAGRVVFADGSPAAGARVEISWRDSAGSPGTTPAMADSNGGFVQNNVPTHATVTEIRASAGPIAATAAPGASITMPREFRLAGLVRRVGDRSPVVGAEIELAGVRTTTGTAGEFKLERVPWTAAREGRPVVHFSAVGYAPLDWALPKDEPSEFYGDLTILMEPKK